MDIETTKQALQALERQHRQYKRQNQFINDNYDRIGLVVKKGNRDVIKEQAAAAGVSVNAYINKLLADTIPGFIPVTK